MKYFTADRYVALQDFSGDAAMDAADAVWDEAVDRYEAHLQTIRPKLPSAILQLLGGYYLHDASALSMGREGNAFVVVLQLDPPPNDLLTIAYELTSEPTIDRSALPASHCSPTPVWLYDELELVEEGGPAHYLHSIQFSNGWEVRLPFSAVRMTAAQPVFPAGRAGRAARSA